MNKPSPMSLIEKAKLYRRKPKGKEITDEEIELSVAWARGEVSSAAVAIATKEGSNIYSIMARGLRAAVQRGILK